LEDSEGLAFLHTKYIKAFNKLQMGKRGRYGKYGETRRFDRLREAGAGQSHAINRGQDLPPSTSSKKKDSRSTRIKMLPAGIKDAGYIRNLSRKVFSKYGPYDDMLFTWFLSGATFTFIAFEEQGPVGFAMLGRSDQDYDFSNVYELLAIAVEPEMQKRGIGSRLLDTIVKKAGGQKAEILLLHTSEDNFAGRKLFKKHGFVTSETKGSFYPKGQDAIMMYKRFVSRDSVG